MDHREKVKLKHGTHTDAGYRCSEPESSEVMSWFYSEKDGVFRKHEFTHNNIVVHLVSAHDFPMKAAAVEQTEVHEESYAEHAPVLKEEKKPKVKKVKKEEPVVEEVKPIEEQPKKVSRKKKGE